MNYEDKRWGSGIVVTIGYFYQSSPSVLDRICLVLTDIMQRLNRHRIAIVVYSGFQLNLTVQTLPRSRLHL